MLRRRRPDPASHFGALALSLVLAAHAATAVLWAGETETAPGGPSPAASWAPARNAVIVSIDALRADHLSCYGATRRTSPNIDALAGRGVLFEQAFASASWTGASLASFFTSTLPARHGVETFCAPGNAMTEGLVSIADAASDAGIGTAFFSAHGGVRAISGLRIGWEHFEDEAMGAEQLVERAGQWIRGRDGRFLAWLHLMEPHTPYLPSPPFATMFLEPGWELEQLRRRYPWRANNGESHFADGEPVDPLEVAFQISQYDACIAQADAAVGALVELLEAQGLLDTTAVIVTSDHGEALGEHGFYFQHGDFLYEGLLHIPLVVRPPGGREAASRRCDLVSALDLAPTVAWLLGLDPRPRWEGRAVLPLPPTPPREHVIAQLTDMHLDSIRDPRYKLVRQRRLGDSPGETLRLYDLLADPGELRDVASEHPEVVERLVAALRASAQPAPRARPEEALPAEVLERLRALGYVD